MIPPLQRPERWRAWHQDCLFAGKRDWLRFLKDWCGSEIFIREAMLGFRMLTESTMQLHNQMLYYLDPKRHGELQHAYLSVYAFGAKRPSSQKGRFLGDYATARLNDMLFDLDREKIFTGDNAERNAKSFVELLRQQNRTGVAIGPLGSDRTGKVKYKVSEDLANAYADMRTLVNRVGSNVGGHARTCVVYTANKGFQVHVIKDWASTIEMKEAYPRLTSGLLSSDGSVLADTARVCRLPFSLHPGTYRQAIIVRPDWPLDKIEAMSEGDGDPLKLQLPSLNL